MQEILIDKEWQDIFRIEDGIPFRKDPNYVGIVNLGSVKFYGDEKLFKKEGHSLLLDLYENSVIDLQEISFLSSAVIIDAKKIIKINTGMFDTFIPYLFVEEISKIIRYGILKSYELKQENKKFLRGKLDVKAQLRNQLRGNLSIGCIYWDLTTDIYLNQILLVCCKLLSSDLALNEKVRSRLTSYAKILLAEGITDENFSYRDLIIISYVPKRYLSAYTLARAILMRKYHESQITDEVDCPSFMIDASAVWEAFLRSAVRKGLTKNGWNVSKSKFSMTLYEPSIIGIPDIMADREDRNQIMIIDAKYKSGSRRVSDLYQVSIYLSALRAKPEVKNKVLTGFLLYLNWEKEQLQRDYIYYPLSKENNSTIYNNIFVMYMERLLNESIKDGKADFDIFSEKLCKILLGNLK